METNLFENLCRYIGQTITVFTTSGGQSGSGFTGVLASVDNHTLKLITSIGASPSCPLGSNCSGGRLSALTFDTTAIRPPAIVHRRRSSGP